MILIFYFVFVALFISSSIEWIQGKESPEVDPDKLDYRGDPIVFACVHEKKQGQFKIVRSNDKAGMAELVKKLNNGYDLSLFIHAIGAFVEEKGYDYDDAQGWFDAASTNICYITYQFEGSATTLIKLIPHMKRMVQENRFEFVAKEVRDLVFNVRDSCTKSYDILRQGCVKNMTQIVMVGFSFGAHIAGQACRYITAKTGEKVKMLIGLDPAAASIFLRKKYYVQKGDANYVQLIHTSKVIGTRDRLGDIDIVVRDNRLSILNPRDKHSLATSIHAATSAKKLIIIADMRTKDSDTKRSADIPKGLLIEVKGPKDYKEPELKSNQCLVGIYSELKPALEAKIFDLNLAKRSHVLWNSMQY